MKLYYSPDYLSGEFETTRKAGWIAESLGRRPIPGVRLVRPTPVQLEDLYEVHDERYVRAVRFGHPRDLAESAGFEWSPSLWRSVRYSTSGIRAAAMDALAFQRHAGSLSSGLHHARRESGHAFCTFNGLALAAQTALWAGAGKVLVLDLDAHCGGGTWSLIGHSPKVVIVDLSTNFLDSYQPDGPSSLDIVHDVDSYFRVLGDRLAQFAPGDLDLLIYNAGMDPHERSGMGALRGMSTDVLRVREDLVFTWASAIGVPVAFCMAGGYVSDIWSIDGLVEAHRLTIERAAAHAISGQQLTA